MNRRRDVFLNELAELCEYHKVSYTHCSTDPDQIVINLPPSDTVVPLHSVPSRLDLYQDFTFSTWINYYEGNREHIEWHKGNCVFLENVVVARTKLLPGENAFVITSDNGKLKLFINGEYATHISKTIGYVSLQSGNELRDHLLALVNYICYSERKDQHYTMHMFAVSSEFIETSYKRSVAYRGRRLLVY